MLADIAHKMATMERVGKTDLEWRRIRSKTRLWPRRHKKWGGTWTKQYRRAERIHWRHETKLRDLTQWTFISCLLVKSAHTKCNNLQGLWLACRRPWNRPKRPKRKGGRAV
jgi:hypothetical protein